MQSSGGRVFVRPQGPRVFAEVVLRQNRGFTLPDDRDKDAENGSILSGGTVYLPINIYPHT